MKKEEARAAIIAEWHRWRTENLPPSETRASGDEAFRFFGYLQSKRPQLLEFRAGGDSWQVIHAWLMRDGLTG